MVNTKQHTTTLDNTFFVREFTQTIDQQIQAVQQLSTLKSTQLTQRPNTSGWNAIECLEHLNAYCRYYNNAIEKGIQKKSSIDNLPLPKSGWFGNKSVDMVTNKGKNIKTMGRMNFMEKALDSKVVILEFLTHQEHLKTLVEKAATKNWNKIKISVEFFKLLKMNFFDMVRFMLAHQERHIQQALDAVE